ncbi:hypothetical protein FNF29_04321 [Cafeteria roenbergensis]|uniref:DUF3668 domain-containing protein n=1 Tax=Cafeteria roenbergensis TaxID=33653 RepID=A0A5A8CFV4_CAFRO|nr:hypothetical protein FNF29_04321 [Cafeteria roenbergensis]|eukprot:KAA0151915.1 hypothetical protein FNF29_04321 [Cafeteria roenbergensis]
MAVDGRRIQLRVALSSGRGFPRPPLHARVVAQATLEGAFRETQPAIFGRGTREYDPLWPRDSGELSWEAPYSAFQALKSSAPHVKVYVEWRQGAAAGRSEATSESLGWFVIDLRHVEAGLSSSVNRRLTWETVHGGGKAFGASVRVATWAVVLESEGDAGAAVAPAQQAGEPRGVPPPAGSRPAVRPDRPAPPRPRATEGTDADWSSDGTPPSAASDAPLVRMVPRAETSAAPAALRASSDAIPVGGRGGQRFVLRVSLSAAAALDRIPSAARLCSVPGRRLWLSYRLFGVLVQSDAFDDPSNPAFRPMRDGFAIAAHPADLLRFLRAQPPLPVHLCTAGAVLATASLPLAQLLPGAVVVPSPAQAAAADPLRASMRQTGAAALDAEDRSLQRASAAAAAVVDRLAAAAASAAAANSAEPRPEAVPATASERQAGEAVPGAAGLAGGPAEAGAREEAGGAEEDEAADGAEEDEAADGAEEDEADGTVMHGAATEAAGGHEGSDQREGSGQREGAGARSGLAPPGPPPPLAYAGDPSVRHFRLSVEVRSVRDVAAAGQLFARCALPELGRGADHELRTRPSVFVPRHAERLLPSPFRAFEFAAAGADLADWCARRPLEVEVWRTDRFREDSRAGLARVELARLLQAEPHFRCPHTGATFVSAPMLERHVAQLRAAGRASGSGARDWSAPAVLVRASDAYVKAVAFAAEHPGPRRHAARQGAAPPLPARRVVESCSVRVVVFLEDLGPLSEADAAAGAGLGAAVQQRKGAVPVPVLELRAAADEAEAADASLAASGPGQPPGRQAGTRAPATAASGGAVAAAPPAAAGSSSAGPHDQFGGAFSGYARGQGPAAGPPPGEGVRALEARVDAAVAEAVEAASEDFARWRASEEAAFAAALRRQEAELRERLEAEYGRREEERRAEMAAARAHVDGLERQLKRATVAAEQRARAAKAAKEESERAAAAAQREAEAESRQRAELLRDGYSEDDQMVQHIDLLLSVSDA